MRLQVAKWGNSLAVRLPASYAKRVGIHIGDYLAASIDKSGEIHLTPDSSNSNTDKAAMLEKIRAFHKTIPMTTSVMDELKENERF